MPWISENMAIRILPTPIHDDYVWRTSAMIALGFLLVTARAFIIARCSSACPTMIKANARQLTDWSLATPLPSDLIEAEEQRQRCPANHLELVDQVRPWPEIEASSAHIVQRLKTREALRFAASEA